jgi:hypothetical protein
MFGLRSFVRSTSWAFALGLCATTAAPRIAAADVHAGFAPAIWTVAVGDTFTAYVSILQADASFNAFDASIRFDPAMLSFDPITPVAAQRGEVMTSACANTFHDFHVTPDSLKVTLSLLCNQTFVTGPGTIYRVRFRAGMNPGTTTISLGPFTEFYRAGLFVRPLDKQDLVVTIAVPTAVEPGSTAGDRLEFAAPTPNPRMGQQSIVLDFTLPASDVVRFDVLDVQGRRVAAREAESYAGGRHRVSWAPPALSNGGYWVRLTTQSGATLVRRFAALR